MAASPRPFVFEGDDLGGELLSVLSEGLYENPLHALREYVQNSVDALATGITIKVTGRSVFVTDDGEGMDEKTLRSACSLGISFKSILENVGFRGIGIYSSFHICDLLRIITKRSGEKQNQIIELDFAKMRQTLDKQRKQSTGSRVNLPELLTKHNQHLVEDTKNVSGHFTTVELSNIVDPYFAKLQSPDEVEAYLLSTITVDFDSKIEKTHREQIDAFLRRYVPGYKPVKVKLIYDGVAPRQVLRRIPVGLQEPMFHVAPTTGKARVVAWGCMNPACKHIDKDVHGNEISGFTQKFRGFTIGDRMALQKYFKLGSGTSYRWFVGEVHVVDGAVKPNAARNDFEPGPAKNRLEEDFAAVLGPFQKASNDAHRRKKFNEAVADARLALPQLKRSAQTSIDIGEIEDQIFHQLDALKKQQRSIKLVSEEEASALTKLISELSSTQKEARQRLTRRRSSVKAVVPPPIELVLEIPEREEPPGLASVIEGFDWPDVDTAAAVLRALIVVVDAVLASEPKLLERVRSGFQEDLESSGLI